MSERKMTIGEVEQIVEKVLSEEKATRPFRVLNRIVTATTAL